MSYEWGEYRKRLGAGEDTSAQYGWTGDNGDPDNFFFLLGCPGGKPGASNATKWCDAPTTPTSSRRARSRIRTARKKIYEEMQVIQHDNEPS